MPSFIAALTRPQAQKGLVSQHRFITEHGTTVSGYVAYYQALGEMDVERIIATRDADLAYLDALRARLHRPVRHT